MTIDFLRPEIVQNIANLASLGLLVIGVTCATCGTKYNFRKTCPDCGSNETIEAIKRKMKKIHTNVTNIFGEDGLPSCGGNANNDEGGGGASSFLSNLFSDKTKKSK